MKRLLIFSVISMLLAAIAYGSSEEVLEKVTLKIEGMPTACCVEKVEGALLKVKGVKKVSVCFKRGAGVVEFEAGKVTIEQLIKTVEKVGYKTSVEEIGKKEEIPQIESKFTELSKKYNIPEKDVIEHWNLVKKEAVEVYERCCKWSLSRGMKIEDAESYCKSAILAGIGEYSLAEKMFTPKVTEMTDDEIKNLVKYRYGSFAEKYADEGNPCPIRNEQVKGLYSEKELSLVSKTARNLALGCGNPVSFANLKLGEVMVDLGCGAGVDVILAAHKVGPSGKVIGVDIAPQMIEKAKQAVAEANLQDRKIELYVGDIEKLQLPNSFADVAISNCVIILVPNKDAAYQEAFRILKPGGRLAISDIVFSEKIDPEIKGRFAATWAGILGGAIAEKDYLEIVKKAGFRQIEIVRRYFLTSEEVMAMSTCPGGEFVPAPDEKDIESVQGKVVSIKFTAIKP